MQTQILQILITPNVSTYTFSLLILKFVSVLDEHNRTPCKDLLRFVGKLSEVTTNLPFTTQSISTKTAEVYVYAHLGQSNETLAKNISRIYLHTRGRYYAHS